MELHNGDPILCSGEALRKRLCNKRFARARRPLENDLAFVFQKGFNLFKEFDREKQFVRKRLKIARRWRRS